MPTLLDTLQNKTREERAELKSDFISKLSNISGKFTDTKYGFTIEVIGVTKIPGGIEILAKAFKGTTAIGFGSDGSVEIERFRIYNPPILIDDINGNIVINMNDNGVISTRRLSFKPLLAIQETLAKIIFTVGKIGSNPTPLKVGNTTSTFYPSYDGKMQCQGSNWNNLRNGDGDLYVSNGPTSENSPYVLNNGAGFYVILRGYFAFNTSSIGSSQVISSATFTAYRAGAALDDGGGSWAEIQSWDPVYSTTDLNTGDFSIGTGTSYSNSTPAYVDDPSTLAFTFNTAGKSAISKTGTTRFMLRDGFYDVSGFEPIGTCRFYIYFVSESGTSNDPTLVVEHAAAATSNFFNFF